MTQRRNFDAAAAAWDDEPRRIELSKGIAVAIGRRIPLSREWDALDFGCGTGLVTMELAPHLKSITGVDSSQGMIDRLNAKIEASKTENIKGIRLDLEKGELPESRFRLITSAMTLHHIPEIVPLLCSLKGLLNPGGMVALADLETEDGSFHEEKTGVFHLGFSHKEMADMLTAAGFEEVSVGTATTVTKGGRIYPVFLATAVSK